jgi:hypothetical protein
MSTIVSITLRLLILAVAVVLAELSSRAADPLYEAAGIRLTAAQSNLVTQAEIEILVEAATRFNSVATNSIPTNWVLLASETMQNGKFGEHLVAWYSNTTDPETLNALFSNEHLAGC